MYITLAFVEHCIAIWYHFKRDILTAEELQENVYTLSTAYRDTIREIINTHDGFYTRRHFYFNKLAREFYRLVNSYWFSLDPPSRFVKCSYLTIYGQRFPDGNASRATELLAVPGGSVLPRTLHLFPQLPNILRRFRANNLRRGAIYGLL